MLTRKNFKTVRNLEITKAFLNNVPLKDLISQYSISRQRVYKLVHTVCSRIDPDVYNQLNKRFTGSVMSSELVKMRQHYLHKIEHEIKSPEQEAASLHEGTVAMH